MDWDAYSGAVGVILWIIFLVAKKRMQKRARPADGPVRVRGQRKRGPRIQKTAEFQRDYEPIEPK